MKFLHTSDWHVGRNVRTRSRDAEHHAALQQLLTYAREQAVDAVLIAGDVFDTSSPSPEAERLVYSFFQELHGAGIPAIVIAGNHDHPRRFDAIAPLLTTINVQAIGEPRLAGAGGDFAIASRDGREHAVVAALPWITERRAIDFSSLQGETSASLIAYEERVVAIMQNLSGAFRPDTVNVLMAHALVNNAVVGPPRAGGERELHMAMGIYGIRRERFPNAAQYIAFGHVHKAQELVKSPAAWYSGSLMQLDFGEVEQEKSVNLVEVHPRQPAEVTRLPIDKGTRKLVDIGKPGAGVLLGDLPAYSDSIGDAWLRVFVDLDIPVTNLPAVVRDILPNAVHVERTRPGEAPRRQDGGEPQVTAPEEMFAAFYRSQRGQGREPGDATLALFRRLLEEEQDADEAP